jgi:hypothetical protein
MNYQINGPIQRDSRCGKYFSRCSFRIVIATSADLFMTERDVVEDGGSGVFLISSKQRAKPLIGPWNTKE